MIEGYHPRHPFRARLIALAIAMGGLGVLGVAAYLSPSPEGIGTHEQLGLAPCSAMRVLGIPCPTCGMTTAFSHTVRGEFVAAIWVQPTGTLLAIGTFAVSVTALMSLLSGRFWRINVYRLTIPKLTFFVVLLLLLGWAWKLATM